MSLPNKDLLTIYEVAEYFSVVPKTIRLWIDNGILEAVKMGGVVRVVKKSIALWDKKITPSRVDDEPEAVDEQGNQIDVSAMDGLAQDKPKPKRGRPFSMAKVTTESNL